MHFTCVTSMAVKAMHKKANNPYIPPHRPVLTSCAMRVDLITRSLEVAGDRCADLTPLVYARLFRAQPEMEQLFWRDTSGAVKGEMLARVIEAILDFIDKRQYSRALIQCEVVTHEGYDVPREVFATFFGTVANTLRDVCGTDWTEETDAAWTDLLAALDFYVRHPDQTMTPEWAGLGVR